MTSGFFFASRAASTPSTAPAGEENVLWFSLVAVSSAIGAVLGRGHSSAFARSLRGSQGAVGLAWRRANRACWQSITNNRLQLLGVLDPALYRLFLWQQAHQIALVGLFHFPEKVLRVAKLQIADRFDSGSAQQLRIFEADTFDPHAIGGGGPIENFLAAGANLLRDPQALLRRLGCAQQTNGRANALRLQHRGHVAIDPANISDGIRHHTIPSAQYLRGAGASGHCRRKRPSPAKSVCWFSARSGRRNDSNGLPSA